MNFLAHYALIAPDDPLPACVLGNALPDLLPLAAPRARFRPQNVCGPATPVEQGVLTHIAADAAFHKAPAFAEVQSVLKILLRDAGFTGIHLRPFFVAHVLAELSLDAALLRAEPTLADAFYAAFAAADFVQATRWAEGTLGMPLPALRAVLSHFARARYLHSYATDAGVAEGLTRLCARARQDTFDGANFARLTAVVAQAVPIMDGHAPVLLAETGRVLHTP